MKLSSFIRRRASIVLLPLSIAPFVGGIPAIVDSHERYQREHHMGPIAAPAAGLSAAEAARYKPFAMPDKRVPVLLWHGVSESRDGISTSRRALSRQLALLKHLGYTTITARQWADFRAGRGGPLPAKPILLTFDDGRLDSYRGADRVLERYGMHASMFVMTGAIEDGDPSYLTWAELHRMEDSGRWDIQPHAHHGHQKVTVAPGRQAPFYAARRYTRSQGRESLAAWESRVSEDLFALRERFTAQGMTPAAFSVPYSDYGQGARNDPAIPRLLAGLLHRQFTNYFLQDSPDPGFTTPGSGAAHRYLMRSTTTLDDLYEWLSAHAAAGLEEGAPAATTKAAERGTAARHERRPGGERRKTPRHERRTTTHRPDRNSKR